MEQKKTVLIVEDEKNIVDIIRFNLQRTGYNTLEAYDGEAGLAMAREKKPDLILLDVMMPKMMGFDVCRALRAEGDNVPVIILTAREEEEDKILGLEIGADDYITKPFSMRELLARVKANIRRTTMLSAPAAEDNAMSAGGGITTPGGKPTMSVMCFGFDTFADASYACWDIHTRWAEKMDKRFGGAPNIRDFIVVPEGVFKSDEEIWEAMTETIIEAGYEGKAGFQMDVATDTYHNKEDGKYYGLFNNQPKTKDQLYEFYLHIIKEFPFVILEDPFNEDDYDTTAALTKDSGIQIVGDDLFTTNLRRVAHGVTKGAANTVLLKVNQIGTISEALEMIQYAYKFGYAVMPSDSRGEGESIADYAVGINAGSVRECGIGPRANRFMEIEAELGKTAKFLGARGLKGFKNQQRADALERKE